MDVPIPKLRVLRDRVIIKPVRKPKATASGLVLPDSDKIISNKGVVLAVGDGHLLPNGMTIPLQVKKGDMVIYDKFLAVELDPLSVADVLVMREENILAIVTPETK